MRRLDRWLRIAAERWRLWVMACATALVAGLCTAWLAGPEEASLQALQTEVAQLQARAAPVANPQPAATLDHLPDWPTPGDAAAAWSWLPQRLQAHGLQLLSLQPQAPTVARGLPEQPVVLRLQGRWSDWLALEQALNAHAPWWLTVAWQVLRADPATGEVRIELQARLGWLPPALQQDPPPARAWPAWQAQPVRSEADAGLFASPSTAVLAAATASAAADGASAAMPRSRDPRQWPVSAWRLQGVWQQAGVAHAVLAAGSELLIVVPGQRIGRDGHRVGRVSDVQVELVGGRVAVPPLHLVPGEQP